MWHACAGDTPVLHYYYTQVNYLIICNGGETELGLKPNQL